MHREEIIMICTSDLAGQVRGKGFPATDLDSRLAKGIGWTPTNSMITAHGPIAPSPWGPYGDTVLKPDPDTRTRVSFGAEAAAIHYMMADIENLDGTPWSVCPRGFLKKMLRQLEERHGLRIKAAFEHEFMLENVEERPNGSYALDAFRRQGLFAETYLGALKDAGLDLDTFMPEYGPRQYEVTVGPANGVRAADHAVAVREVARAVAQHFGSRACFTPISRPDAVGNGVHMHFSLIDAESGSPVNYDAEAENGLSGTAASFLSGVLSLMPAFTALTAAGTISYLRLTPNRWSAAYNNLGARDREAGLRICPVFPGTGTAVEKQFHFEFRAADATASPYLVLGAIVAAGLHGLEKQLPPPPVCPGPPQDLEDADLKVLGIRKLPGSLGEALDLLEASEAMRSYLGDDLHSAYLAHKRFEDRMMAELSPQEQCERYRMAY